MGKNIVTITQRVKYEDILALKKKAFTRHNSSQNPRGEQEEVGGGERQASRIRHALPDTVIHQAI